MTPRNGAKAGGQTAESALDQKAYEPAVNGASALAAPSEAAGDVRAALGDRRLQAAASFAVYTGLSVVFFGLRLLPHPSRSYLGFGVDPTTFIWYLKWWPHAILHGLNPLHTSLLWAPGGIGLAQGNAVPGLAIPATPLTLAVGPVIAYNVLVLLAPALTAWTMYLLARHVTRAFWPSLVAGYVFGFSTYELGRLLGHLNLAMVFLVPVALYLVLRRLEDAIPARRLVLLLAVVLLFQMLISAEVAVTLAVFGGLTLLVTAAIGPAERRRPALAALGAAAVAYGLAAVVLAPYIVSAIRSGLSGTPVYDFYPTFYSSDLLNFILPTAITRFGRTEFATVTARFTGNLSEQVAYLGLPLLVVVGAYVVQRWRMLAGKVLAISFGVVAVATLGPRLHIAGDETISWAWRPILRVPLLKYALPGRFMMYAFLLTGLAVALWLAGGGPRPWARWALALAGVILLVPNTASTVWSTEVDTPRFFSDGIYRRYLAPDDTALIIPFGDRGNSMLWQAEADLSFRMAEGYVNVVPPEEFSAWPILRTLYDGTLFDGYTEQLPQFLGAHGVRAVIVADRYPGPWADVFGQLGTPDHVGGVFVYRVPDEILRTFADARPPG